METTQNISSSGTPGRPRPSLAIHVGDQTYTVHAREAPISIGREFPAQICIDDDRISRTHVRIDCTPRGWVAVDQSSDGIFIDGARQPRIPISDATTIQLGHPKGFPVTFRHRDPPPPDNDIPGDEDDTEYNLSVDPGVARAGAAVTARREELKLTQRYLARSGIVNAGALIDFEKGRRWPRKATLAKLEDALQWPHGTIARIRRERVEPDDEETVVSATVRAPLMAEAVEVALDSVGAAIESLPATSEQDFTLRVTRILADLRKLEGVAAGAARSAKGDPEVALVLSAVRKTYKDLMLRAARAPSATLGQRLFAARYRAELSAEETANAAGVPVDVITAAEAEVPLDPRTMAALSAACASLTRR